MSYEKTHDGVMNNIESLVEYTSSLEFLDYSSTNEYSRMSNAIFEFFKAVEEDTLTESEDD